MTQPHPKRKKSAERRSTQPPPPVREGQPTKPPGRARWIEELDRMAHRPLLEGDYLPGPIAGTDIKDRSLEHPLT